MKKFYSVYAASFLFFRGYFKASISETNETDEVMSR